MKSTEILRECATGQRGYGDTMDLVADAFGCTVPMHSYVLLHVVEAVEKELKERYMELPADADGVPIHVGDKVVSEYGEETRVVAVTERAFVTASDQICLKCSTAFHHKHDVSGVLREFAIACEDAGNAGEVVNRLIDEYAERLQLKEES